MASGGRLHPKSKPFSYQNASEEEEGLLSGISDGPEHSEKQQWSRRKIILVAVLFIMLLISGAFVRTLLRGPVVHSNSIWHTGGDTQTNGTHEFKRTVLIISIDGLR